jgi:6-pyruvoyltetrahydropterin/6-carboxytetrahydropterin synthase
MVHLTRKTGFSALHRLHLPALSPEENERRFGPASREWGHGHDYVVEVTVSGRVDRLHGMVVNITDLKPILAEQVAALDGEFFTSGHPLIGDRLPGPEVLARLVWDRVHGGIRAAGLPVRLERVDLRQSRTTRAACERGEEGPMVTLTRTYEFAAAHRLHASALPSGENRKLFGKCNNPTGHGHNYLLEVTVGGEPDPQTGLLFDPAELDRVVNTEVVDRYDHHHLNYDLPEFEDLNPTSENLVRVIWDRLKPALPDGVLRRVLLRETDRNSFTYEGEDH